ncbi:matrixin family metalloprotease [Bradyrhizobium sp. LHD-71]|uniref:matrixin family metalloprotease n=1 Tax=Bradyrhizobium sp. LHD-71 TaxID=3072141 RepID=UPI00280F63C5|nr:matrixin family metalloprotease [Bradyrhizobium sp. LHD-71]MDQ8729800.1 matrixin family metalloprotease [Bradyrhizobium sp. LHD-71]
MPSYVLEEAHWAPGSTVTWYYAGTSAAVFEQQISAGYAAPDLFPEEIRAAFSRWDDFGEITFQEVSSEAAANIVIGWAEIDGPYNVLGQAGYYYDPATGLFASPVQINFDSSELYNPSSGSEALSFGATFYAVALHEIGHAIGIGHYSDEPAIMNPYISSLNDLTASDIAAVQALYGAADAAPVAGLDSNWQLAAVSHFNGGVTTDRAAALNPSLFPEWTSTGDLYGSDTFMWRDGSSGDVPISNTRQDAVVTSVSDPVLSEQETASRLADGTLVQDFDTFGAPPAAASLEGPLDQMLQQQALHLTVDLLA